MSVLVINLVISSFLLFSSCTNSQVNIKPEVIKSEYKPTFNSQDSIISIAKKIHSKWGSDKLHRKVVIIDFSKPMESARLFIVDIDSSKIIKSTKVCHGIGSGASSIPTSFSNEFNSRKSSKGIMRTAETYYGGFGYSLRVDGLQNNNSNVRRRTIIFHCSEKQRTPWSWGCFSMPKEVYKEIINIIKGGCLVFSFSDTSDFTKI